MKYFVILLVLIGFIGTVFALEPKTGNYFSNPDFEIYNIHEQSHTFFIPYSITNSKINYITMDCPSRAIVIDIEPVKEDGTLTIVLPRTLLDSRYGPNDDSFFILVDGQEVEYSEIEKNAEARVLNIPFFENSSQVEIIVATLISQSDDPLKFVPCGKAGHEESQFYKILSPLKQFKSGIDTKDVVCKQSPIYYQLVMKKSNNQPICIKGTSVNALTLRNYIPEYNGSLGGEIPIIDNIVTPMSLIKVNNGNQTFSVNYNMTNGFIRENYFNDEVNTLILSIESFDNGTLRINLPRELIDSKMWGGCPSTHSESPDDVFFIVIDGYEVLYKEIQITDISRIIEFPFMRNASEIEIIGSCLL